MYKIVLTKGAQKEYTYLYNAYRPIFNRVRAALNSLAENPCQGKPLKFKLKGKWSYRVGVYRIIYSIAHRVLTVYLLEIGHRRKVYR